MFCAATGFAGTPKVGTGRFDPERLTPVESARRIKVHFNADKSEQLPWKFTPQQKFVSVLPGETSLAFYTAKNNSKQDIIGIATYNVTPDRVRYMFIGRSREYANRKTSRLLPTSLRWSASVSRNKNCLPGKRLTCPCCSSSIKTCSMIQVVEMSKTLSYRTHFSGKNTASPNGMVLLIA